MVTRQKRIEKRRSYALKLTPGKHDNLIAWLDRMPKGKRQTMMIAALELLMEHDKVTVQPVDLVADELAYLRQALENMPDWLEARFAAVRAAIQNATIIQPGDGQSILEPLPRMTDEQQEKRAANMDKLADW